MSSHAPPQFSLIVEDGGLILTKSTRLIILQEVKWLYINVCPAIQLD